MKKAVYVIIGRKKEEKREGIEKKERGTLKEKVNVCRRKRSVKITIIQE